MKKFSFIFLFFIVLTSCEKALMPNDATKDPMTNFEELWKVIDEKYSFFDYKNINWQLVHDQYASQINSQMSDAELFSVLSNVLNELKDGHVNLSGPYNFSRYWNWYLDSPASFSYDIIERNYLGDSYEITGPLDNRILNDSIGYIYYESFGRNISPSHLNYLHAKFSFTKAIIIDIRDNPGGSLSNAELLSSFFNLSEKEAYLSYYKNGKGQSDFIEIPLRIPTKTRTNNFGHKPIYLLTNRKSYSASTFFAAHMSVLPNVTIIGDTTGGGGGLPISHVLPNGWSFRFSSTISTTIEGFNFENGFPPDIHLQFNPNQQVDGKDPILEKAIEEINK